MLIQDASITLTQSLHIDREGEGLGGGLVLGRPPISHALAPPDCNRALQAALQLGLPAAKYQFVGIVAALFHGRKAKWAEPQP